MFKGLCHELGYCCFRSLRNECATLITLFHYPFAICSPPPHPPKVLENFCFSFLLAIAVVPGEIEDNNYAIFFFLGGGGGGQTRCIMGDPQIANTQNAPQDAIIAFLYLSCIKPLEKEFCSVNLPSKQPLSLHMHQKPLKKSQPESHQPV